MRVLDAKAVAGLLRRASLPLFMRRLSEALVADFLRWDQFTKSARLAAHHPKGVVELMPVFDGDRFAFKYVNGHPANTARQKLTVIAFGVLADMETGLPLLLADMTFLTALRTAVMSALVAQKVRPQAPRRLALIGTGAQAEFQILAFHHLLGIREVALYDRDPAAMQKVVRNLSGIDGLQLTLASDAASAVRGADVVTTAIASKRREAVLTTDLVVPGMHINAIGGDCPGKTELDPQILRRADALIVEYAPQTRVEGEIQNLPPDFPVIEFAEWLRRPRALAPTAITVFDSVGFALEDFTALRCLYEISQEVPESDFFPSLKDPKDLYGAL